MPLSSQVRTKPCVSPVPTPTTDRSCRFQWVGSHTGLMLRLTQTSNELMETAMKTHFGIFTFVIIACISLFAGRTMAVNSPPAGKHDDSRVAGLAEEVCKKGWIVYAARTLTGDWTA